ncbi:tyrosine-type recombinase/integrase [Paucibacter sp. B2R-40]|uniref:site-specific integrase n=1 Tax=Paucibacter sp. B2R-40 TaxID=2893554 RepID=UPI0021E4F848|nr:site-specific integrase [Paucibacter sp. B2R-40]MCV2353567.1 tyrosine-type recombinase/integrase [Paucibacter sp. B2R-40]
MKKSSIPRPLAVLPASNNQPYLVITRDGVEFDSRMPTWPIDAQTTLYVEDLCSLFDSELAEGLVGTLRNLVSKFSANTVHGHATVLRHYHRTIAPSSVIHHWDASDLRGYRESLINEFGHEEYLIRLRAFLKHWGALRQPGVSADTTRVLREMRLKASEKGRAVRIQDPQKGPLTPDELLNLTRDIYRGVEAGDISLELLSLVVFHIVTGRRTGQSAALKCLDVDRSRKGDPTPGKNEGEQLYLLHVPRAKQQGHGFRRTRRSIQLIEVNFALFEAQREMVRAEFNQLLEENGFQLQHLDVEHLLACVPLFPNWKNIRNTVTAAKSLREQSHALALATLRTHAEGQLWHLTRTQVTKMLQKAGKLAGAKARDGTPLQLDVTRLRYTKGTDLARQGVNRPTIAWLLDHSNLDSAGIYIDNLPEHAAHVNEALKGSLVMNHVAALFRGEIVDSEADAVAGNVPQQSRIYYQGNGAATCGIQKQCGLGGGIPLACYTCERFQPWIDGPHESVLADLLRERSLECKTLGDDHPVTRRRDATISAVINVVQRCTARKQELAART